jgi:steroid delta-isomerase-like uncharacterized protein
MPGESNKTEQYKSIVRRFIEEVINKGNLNLVEQYCDSRYVLHDPSQPSDVRGFEALKQNLRDLRTAFPDISLKIDEIFADGEKVCCRWTGTATHKAEYMGIAPTNKKAKVMGLEIFHLSNFKIVEDWNVWDTAGFLKQIGVMPELEHAY